MKDAARRNGFTLIEIMLVLGIMGILAAIVLIAVNPSKQLSDARAADRAHAVREIENAITQYIIDGNTITAPDGIANAVEICQSAVLPSECTTNPPTGFDLSFLAPDYLVYVPIDPNQTGTKLTGYYVYRSGSFIKVCSPVLDSACGG